jgi:uncharacterized protein YigA (DUF484 family)
VTAAAEQALAADRERRLAMALAAGGLGTWEWDVATGRVGWDERLEAIYGLEPGTFGGTYDDYQAMIHPADRAHVRANVDAAVASGEGWVVLHRIVRPDSSTRWIEGHGQPTFDAAGRITGGIGVSRDVTGPHVTHQRALALGRLSDSLAGAMTLEQVTATVRQHAEEQFDAANGALFLLGEVDRDLHMAATFGYPDDVVADFHEIPADAESPVVDALRSQQPILLGTVAEFVARYPALAGTVAQTGSQAVAALPLVVGGEAGGVLLLGFAAPRPFDAGHEAFLASLAGQAAQAVARARVVSRLQDIATSLQRELAPGALPEVAGVELTACYQPGGDALEEVGGDWYDALALPDGRLALVVGDVMGRGVQAASTMSRISSMIRAFASVDPEPASVLGMADRLLAAGGETFVTVCYVLLDPALGAARVGSAGHPPPLVVLGSGETRLLPSLEAPPLGLSTLPRAVQDVALAVGDVLVLYTDGLVERHDRPIDDGLASLAATAGPLATGPMAQGVARLVVDMLDRDAGDDVTVLAVRRTAS